MCVVSAEIAINSCTMYVQLLIKKTFNFIPENWNSSDDKIDKIHLRAFIKSLFSNRNNFITFILILNCSFVVCILCCLVCDVRCTVYGVWCVCVSVCLEPIISTGVLPLLSRCSNAPIHDLNRTHDKQCASFQFRFQFQF